MKEGIVLRNMFKFMLCNIMIVMSSSALSETVRCPDPESFKAVNFNTTEKGDHPGVWTLIQQDQYHTSYQWKFSLMLEASDQASALQRGKNALSKLHKLRGPQKIGGVWMCDYKAPKILSAVAVTQVNNTVCSASDKKEIMSSIKYYLDHGNSAIAFDRVQIMKERCLDNFASAIVHPKQNETDDATVYLKKENGQWKVLLLGTDFGDALSKLQVPKELR